MTEGANTNAEPGETTDYALDDQVGYLLRRANQRHLSIFNNAMPEGITAQQFAVLVRMRDLGETSQNELGRQVCMDQSTINGVVQRLTQRGLVTRVKSPRDQRRLMLSLTESGQQTVEDLLPVAAGISEQTLAPLSERECRSLIRLLRKLG